MLTSGKRVCFISLLVSLVWAVIVAVIIVVAFNHSSSRKILPQGEIFGVL